MKKLTLTVMVALFIISTLWCTPTMAESQPQVKFNNKTYTLKFSEKSQLTDGFINEFYKSGEKFANWSELVGVYHYPSYSSPDKLVSQFERQLKQKGLTSTRFLDQKNGKVGVIFIVAGKGTSEFLEYNIFKYEKYKTDQVIALQYARRYTVNKNTELSKIANEIQGMEPKLIDAIKNTQIPPLVEKNVSLGK